MQVSLEALVGPPPDAQPVEIVERKGLGHPDTICDALAEELSLSVVRFCRDRFGTLLHHNVDKALLCAGRAAPVFGGGRVLEPIDVVLAGRATLAHRGVAVPVEELAVEGSRRWLAAHLRHLDPTAHVQVHVRLRPGSVDLVDLYRRGAGAAAVPANDTSIGVGFAPLSALERIVLAVEGSLTAGSAHRECPELGEDVKVMAVRRGRDVDLTVACAFVDRYVSDADDYAVKKARLAASIAAVPGVGHARITVNAADDPERDSFYLTVTGTSAESGDDGQAGRGNRVNGLITPGRPMTLEAVAGKNPVSHVGKLYNLAAGLIAEDLVGALPRVAEAHCWLVSRIGSPIGAPPLVHLRLRDVEGAPVEAHAARAEEIARDRLGRLGELVDDLLEGRIVPGRWPLRGEPDAVR
jgi:S-adenosylmethionine synthetase